MRKTIVIASLAALVCYAQPLSSQEKMKIILDTDIGGDIDDAWALGFVINYPDFQPLGVTITDGRTKDRAKIALKLLHRTGRDDVPVAVGRETPRIWFHQFAWAEDYTTTKPVDAPAAQFLVDIVNKYPKQVTVIAVGPLQNVADAMRLSDDFKKNVKELVLMSGCVHGRADTGELVPEWNVRGAIKDAQVVYAAGIPTRIVPLDSTMAVRLSDKERTTVAKHDSPLTRSLESLYRLWIGGPKARMTLHDQLALAEAAKPGLFFGKRETLPLIVDDEGYTRIDQTKGRPIIVCLEPKRDAFMKSYIDVLKR
ncbi:MAG: nucleoside hydrolase [Phycisphaerae bacterium]|nr:nucleoside hydrolase [Phycisphaerae bacterium]